MSARGSQDSMTGEVWQVIRLTLSLHLQQIYLTLSLVFQFLSSGDGANCKGNQGVEKDSARCSTGEVDDMFYPPLASTPKQQPTQAPTHFKSPQDLSQAEPGSQASNTFSEDSQPGKSIPTRCDNCKHLGPFANHLREASRCLQSYRGYPEFQIQGDDEGFIVKACIIIKECPAPCCAHGSHRRLPEECLKWWKETGTKLMNWRGVDGSSSAATIQAKIRKFRDNHNGRQKASTQPSQGVNTGSDQCIYDSGARSSRGNRKSQGHLTKYGLNTKQQKCLKCSSSNSLATHLQESEDCLHAYQREYFAGRSDLRTREPKNPRKAIFDLSLLLHFCPNPTCSMTEDGGGPAEHLDGPCSQYIIEEGVAVYGWKHDVGKERFKGSLKRKATYLQQISEQQQLAGPRMFRQELSAVLKMTCRTCFIQGPLLDAKDHKLVECLSSSPVLWQCQKCNASQGERQDILRNVVRNMNKHGGPTHKTSLKPVRIDDGNGQQESIVFMPSCLTDNLTLATELSIFDPPSTTVLVPQHPDGLDVFDEEALNDAFKERKELKEISEFITKRMLLDNNPTTPLSLLFRKKLADVRQERANLLKSMQSSSKGTVISHDPNLGNIKSRNPHYAATKSLSLTSTCSWSEGHLQQRADESNAISCVNGQVKTKVNIGILKNLAVGSPELAVVMNQLADYHFEGRGVALLSTAPIVLQFAKAKVGLLMKHVISQQYENWDLHVNFEKDKWGVELVGFLYSSEYGEINRKIAKEGSSLPEIVAAVIRRPELQPTASLDKGRIAEHYGMSAEEAEVLKSLLIVFEIILFITGNRFIGKGAPEQWPTSTPFNGINVHTRHSQGDK